MSIFGIFFAPVPEPFWSEYSGKPFIKCIDCDVPLLESNVYVVQKRFVAGEAVFEMAMCEHCRNKMTEEYSEETKQKITEFMGQQFHRNSESLLENSDQPQVIEVHHVEDPERGQQIIEECMNRCLMCSAERKDCHRYSLAGLCRDTELVAQLTPISRTPLMICDQCEQGMAGLISKKTRDAWDRFIDEHFDGPPGVESDIPGSYPVAF